MGQAPPSTREMHSHQTPDVSLIATLGALVAVACAGPQPEPDHRAQLTIPEVLVPVRHDMVRLRSTDFSVR